jgi:hypothetical protein
MNPSKMQPSVTTVSRWSEQSELDRHAVKNA